MRYSIRAAQQDSAFKMTYIEAKSFILWLRYEYMTQNGICVETRCFGSYLSQIFMDFALIWVMLKAESCWAALILYRKQEHDNDTEPKQEVCLARGDPQRRSVLSLEPSFTLNQTSTIQSLELMWHASHNVFSPSKGRCFCQCQVSIVNPLMTHAMWSNLFWVLLTKFKDTCLFVFLPGPRRGVQGGEQRSNSLTEA